MTLAEIVRAHPDLFYRQEWYDGHTFVDAEPADLPEFTLAPSHPWPRPTVTAADLAALYVANPTDSRWRKFIWTDDVDSYGCRVYVGGVGEYGIEAFQIHRHLQPAAYWVMAA